MNIFLKSKKNNGNMNIYKSKLRGKLGFNSINEIIITLRCSIKK